MQALKEVRLAAEEGDFGAWVAARSGALQRFAYLITGSADDAADLVQEVLSRVYPRWESLAGSGTAEAYVRRSMINASNTGWRKRRRQIVVSDPTALVRASLVDPMGRIDDTDYAWGLVQSLPIRQRAAVVLRYFEDLPFAEIALILECPEATARSQVHRAVAALRAQLEQEVPDA